MSSKSIHINDNLNTHFTAEGLQPASVFARVYQGLRGLVVRSELEKARAAYRTRQQRQAPRHQLLDDLPIEDKMRNGMYRWMD